MSNLQVPYSNIHRVVGRRSLPRDWPKSYDSWDAYDEAGEFLLTLHYKALAQLLDGCTLPHSVILDFEDDVDHERRVVITSNTSFNLTIRLNFGDGLYIDNPDVLLSKPEIIKLLGQAMVNP